jgi:hypothetical protein
MLQLGIVALAARVQADDLATMITVRASHHAYHNAPVSFLIATVDHRALSPRDSYFLTTSDGQRLPCQLTYEDNRNWLIFLLPDLPQGETRTYHLQRAHGVRPSVQEVTVKQEGADLAIHIGSALFTRYTTHSGPNKPFFYPILTPEGDPMTRRWPMEQNTGESNDHIHHRGLWFTHSSVNGVDFWTEGKGTGKTVNQAFLGLVSGPVFGGFQAHTEWRGPDNTLIATDVRTVRIYSLPNGDRLMDFAITLRPADKPLVLGDNKDGVFGLRLPDSLAPARKEGGHIITSTGNKDSAAWGKAADWVDYWGPIQGKTYGVAIFDHPDNLRHPETWHARDYGLFTVNPFGLHDFGLGPKGAGDYTIPQDGHLTLRYRLLFHKGDTNAAGVAEQYAAYTDPPEVEVSPAKPVHASHLARRVAKINTSDFGGPIR